MTPLVLRQRLLFGVLLGLLSGCHSNGLISTSEDLAETGAWLMKGRAIVKTPAEAKRVYVFWQQDQNHYDIRLTGTLGVAVAHIVGGEEGVYIDIPGRPRQYADAPDQLLFELTGLDLPIASMRYWLRGESAPTSEAEWQVDYVAYKDDLPSQLTVTHPEVRIKLDVTEWR